MTKPALQILLASPRGFCAGVVRAIDVVEAALKEFCNVIVVDGDKNMPALFSRANQAFFSQSAQLVRNGGLG